MFELSKQFRFDAAHTLERVIDTEQSRRIHGHSYRAEVTVKGAADASGMVIDLGLFERALEDVRRELDHNFLNHIEGLGPATLENLSVWIWDRLAAKIGNISKIAIYRDSCGESCIYRGPNANA